MESDTRARQATLHEYLRLSRPTRLIFGLCGSKAITAVASLPPPRPMFRLVVIIGNGEPTEEHLHELTNTRLRRATMLI